jgi:hypothetical protein
MFSIFILWDASNLLFLRQAAFIKFFLPIRFFGTVLFSKKSAKMLRNPYSAPVSETPNRTPNIKYIVPAFHGKVAVCAHTTRGGIFVLIGYEL